MILNFGRRALIGNSLYSDVSDFNEHYLGLLGLGFWS
jgi:hypothetical protein